MGTAETDKGLSPIARIVSTCALLFWLFIVLIGPLSNPVGSQSLTVPMAETVSPLHRAFFLGHGYRFFAPDPGPSHLVEFEITKSDGSKVNGVFPDRDDPERSFPRLLYHRWFMLSETIWAEHSMTPLEADFLQQQRQLEMLATEKKVAGHHEIASRIRADMETQKHSYERARKRIDEMVRAVAANLLESFQNGVRIRLCVREREIPFPFEIEEGTKLDDQKYLKPKTPLAIGEFTRAELECGTHE